VGLSVTEGERGKECAEKRDFPRNVTRGKESDTGWIVRLRV